MIDAGSTSTSPAAGFFLLVAGTFKSANNTVSKVEFVHPLVALPFVQPYNDTITEFNDNGPGIVECHRWVSFPGAVVGLVLASRLFACLDAHDYYAFDLQSEETRRYIRSELPEHLFQLSPKQSDKAIGTVGLHQQLTSISNTIDGILGFAQVLHIEPLKRQLVFTYFLVVGYDVVRAWSPE